MEKRLFISSSPHVHDGVSSARIMWTVVAALLPASFWSIYLFGMPAVQVIVGTVLFSVLTEAVWQGLMKQPVTIKDGSAVLTGLLLALTLPPGLHLGICAVGAVVAIVLAKGVFGGLGQNPFNPALTSRVFLLIAFPAPLTRWLVPRGTGETLYGKAVTAFDASGKLVQVGADNVDAVTAATPLGLLAEAKLGERVSEVSSITVGDEMFLGMLNGSIGETSALFLLVGGVALIAMRIITWHIPVAYLASVAAFAAISHAIDGQNYAGAVFHLFTGSVILGALFMATDYVTSPMFPLGKIVFGVGCGILTMVIRLWAGYPEGVSFAILLMNAAVPIIDRYTRPKKFGLKRVIASEGAA